MHELGLLLQHTAISACLHWIETVLQMSVSLRVPSGKRWHIQTGQLKDDLYRFGQGTERATGRTVSHSQEPQAGGVKGRGWLAEPRESSFRERSLIGELVFRRGTQPTHDSFGLVRQVTQMSLLGNTGR